MTRITRISLLFVLLFTLILVNVKYIKSSNDGDGLPSASFISKLTDDSTDDGSSDTSSELADDDESNDSPEDATDAEDVVKQSASTLVTSTALPSTVKVSTSTLSSSNGPTETDSTLTSTSATTSTETTTAKVATSGSSSSSTSPGAASPSASVANTNVNSSTSTTRDAKTTTAPSATSTTPMTITLTYTTTAASSSLSESQGTSTSATSSPSTTTTTATTTTTRAAGTSESPGEDEEGEEEDSSDGEGEEGGEEATSQSPRAFVEKTIRVAVDQVKPILNNLEKELSNKEKSNDDIHVYRVVDDFGKLHTYSSSTRDTIEILNRLSQFTSLGLDAVFKETIPYITSIGYESNISSPCLASMLKLLTGLRKQEIWAFRFIDSFGRISPGTFDGTVSNFGEYHECVDIDFPSDFEGLEDVNDAGSPGHASLDNMADVPEEKVVGKYCLMRVDIPMPPKPLRLHIRKPVINVTGTNLENTILQYISRSFDSLYTIDGFRFGVCLPSTCSADEITSLINKGKLCCLFHC